MAEQDRNSEQHRPPGVAAYLLDEARNAVHDIRQKVFEEGWFGRPVTGMPVTEIDRTQLGDLQPNILPSAHLRAEDDTDRRSADAGPTRTPSFEDVWGRAARDLEHDERQRDRDGPGIER